MQDSIIAYRNPMEKALWEGLSDGSFFPIIAGVIVFFAVFLLINTFIVDKFFGRYSAVRLQATYVALAVGAGAAIAAVICLL
jgi:hypothetical protein|tara:strand:+ start:6368 stop:6613 length:246 start_codon:yes stop_codon:yes gene_type:complete